MCGERRCCGRHAVAAQRSLTLYEAELRKLPNFESSLHEIALLRNMALALVVVGEHSESIALGQRAIRRALEIGARRLPDEHLALGVATVGGETIGEAYSWSRSRSGSTRRKGSLSRVS
jgi:hypothetical protein